MTTQALAIRDAELALTGPLGSLDAYLERISRVPVLTREDEYALARRLRDANDVDAARTLVLSHLRFVVHIARGYRGYGLPMGDIVQEGNVGLMKAVKRFDPELGVRLVSFAVHWIRAEIHEYVLRNWRLVKVATTKAQRKLFFNLRRMKKNLSWLSADETAVVARELGVSPSEVTEMERRLSARDLSFDPLAVAGEDDESYAPTQYLPAPNADPAVSVEDDEWEQSTQHALRRAIEELDPRSRDIVQSRWMAGDNDKATLHDLAARYGVSAERVRQLEANAIKKLRSLMLTPA
jgi:RNA polymerase sigma-32 factor